ncbi:hypothetical protein BSKO_04959 [Bryopsis sp. KO-2023]|nr:hypothetical protein BSKO_04959 [Bryopsis sp. KO-2023]
MEDAIEGKDYSFPKEEEKILQHWDEIDAFQEQLRRTQSKPEYIFYDGPPFATGLPHYGHLLAGTLKDIVTRYASSTGHHVSRRFGWDCHGLPVEYEIDKAFDIKSREDVLKMGIGTYNEECRKIVMRYSKEWEKTVKRLGRWIDFENDYKTLDPTFMESVWWVFKNLWDKDLVYQGFKVMAYSTGCGTPLSNFEAGLNYKDVQDPSIMASFPLDDDPDGTSLIAWTTTPWTLPSNVALCVNPAFDYIKVRDPQTNKCYIVAESRLSEIPGAVPKKAKKKDSKDSKPAGFEILQKMKGSELVGKGYAPLFPYFQSMKAEGAFRVVSDGYVTSDSGTGVVHQAPAFGEDDYRVCLAHGIIKKGGTVPCPVDDAGKFTPEVTDFAGIYVKEADKDIIKAIKGSERLVQHSTLQHSYPFCWRSDTPLIYKAVPSWFVRVESIKERLLACNAETYWVPNYVKEKRFHNWLENARDWAISRSRFWGTPLPIWASEDGEEFRVVGSKEELERLSGKKVDDLHRHFIDDLTIPSEKGKGVLKRVDEVFDCWFESGSMPYAQLHYPFENKELFEANFPADFIAEGLDQTRGWFYTLMVLSTALFDKPAFKSVVVNGLVLASDGRKMSKRLKNYPDPVLLIDQYGADALRLYLINSPVVRAETLRFKEDGVFGVVKDVFLPWYNAYRFLVQNVLRWEMESGKSFDPTKVDLSKATNVLDRWIGAAARSLTNFVRQEMDAYRLYTVVPYLVKFVENLTNIYVRFNRKRLKGKGGDEDCQYALASLFHVMLTVCKVMSPFTPFFTEKMYMNLIKCLPDMPPSVHFCDYPEPAPEMAGDEKLQESVDRMQRVIELARYIREQKKKPIKMPIKSLTVVHPDDGFLADITGELKEYVIDEINTVGLEVCSDPKKYATLKAEPDWKLLGQRLGKKMGPVAKAIKEMSPEAIAQLEQSGKIELGGQEVMAEEVKVLREFKPPEGVDTTNIEANGDSDVLVVMDLSLDTELLEQGLAREIVNRFQKLRKKAGLTVTDVVELYYEIPGAENGTPVDPMLLNVLQSRGQYFKEAMGVPLLAIDQKFSQASVELARESQVVGGDESKATFIAIITTPSIQVNMKAIKEACGGDDSVVEGVLAYLASRDRLKLKEEVDASGGSISVRLDGIDHNLTSGKHIVFEANGSFV